MKRGLVLAAVLVLTAGLARDSYSQITGSIIGVVRDQKAPWSRTQSIGNPNIYKPGQIHYNGFGRVLSVAGTHRG
jgi:hypothetical protein